MQFQIAVIILAAIMAMLTVAWGAVSKGRFVAVGLVALAVVSVAGLLSWYAAIETQSVPWAVAYGVVAIVSAVVAVRHLLGRRGERHEI